MTTDQFEPLCGQENSSEIAQLRAFAAMFQDTTNVMAQGLIVLGEEEILLTNPRMREMLDVPAELIEPVPLCGLVGVEDRRAGDVEIGLVKGHVLLHSMNWRMSGQWSEVEADVLFGNGGLGGFGLGEIDEVLFAGALLECRLLGKSV